MSEYPDPSDQKSASDVETASYVPRKPVSVTSNDTVIAGRYKLGAKITHGGMGEVHRAVDLVFDREVVIKTIRPEYVGPESIGRFVAEARISGQLQHPGIPPVHDLGTLPNGAPFLAMKLIQGETLASAFRGNPAVWSSRTLPRLESSAFGKTYRLLKSRLFGRVIGEVTDVNPPQLTDRLLVIEKVAEAVAYAHGQGVIHRDLKPHNVMIGAFGEVQVMDWGLAKELTSRAPTSEQRFPEWSQLNPPLSQVGASEQQTQAGTVLGTPAYMPPEQARGESHLVNRQSDVFALGAILCELFTGSPPFIGSAAECLAQSTSGSLYEALERLDRCAVDRALVKLAESCLAPDPTHRPVDAAAVAQALANHRTAIDMELRQAEIATAKGEASNRVWSDIRIKVGLGGLVILVIVMAIGTGTLKEVVKSLVRQPSHVQPAAFPATNHHPIQSIPKEQQDELNKAAAELLRGATKP